MGVRYLEVMAYAQPSPGGDQSPKSRSRVPLLLGLLAALSALLGLLLLSLGLAGVLSVATPNMQGFNPGQSVAISDAGMSVYSRSDARSGAVCTADTDSGQVVFERPVQEYAVDVAGTDFYELARSPADLGSGTYAVTCEGTSEAVYAGPAAPDTSASGVMGPAGIVSGLFLLVLAVLLAVAALLLGRRGGPSASVGSAQQPGGQQGWQGSSGYSSPYATPPQQARPYAPPPGQEPSTGGSSYPYGAPPPPPPSGDPYTPPGQQPPRPETGGQREPDGQERRSEHDDPGEQGGGDQWPPPSPPR